LQTAFGIAAELDDDGNAGSQRSNRPAYQPKMAAETVEFDPGILETIATCETLAQLADEWKKLTPEQRTVYTAAKDKRKKELEHE